MRNGLKSKVDPNKLLPEDLRQKWVVIDRIGGYFFFIGGMLFGGGLAVTVVGYMLGRSSMIWGFEIALACMILLKTIRAPSERRLLSELRGRVQ